MSMFAAMNVGILGLIAQTEKLSTVSDNIANLNTEGYKTVGTSFSDLVTSPLDYNYSPGGVLAQTRQFVTTQGTINPADKPTDVAISGQGFFAVTASTNTNSALLYTRAGSFSQNSSGFLVNGAGFYLQGWKLDGAGNLPADLSTASLEPIQVVQVTETPEPTTDVSVQSNLKLTQALFTGAYDPANPASNMASGTAPPAFTGDIHVTDSLGADHLITAGFLKTGSNSWAMELYSADTTVTGGQLAYGTAVFNGDGTLQSISPALQNVSVNWKNGTNNALAINWGTAGPIFGTPGATVVGKNDGLSQYDEDYTNATVHANGFGSGLLTEISVDSSGYVIAHFDNDTKQNIYKIPIAEFRNANGLQGLTGNIYTETSDSGGASLIQASQDAGALFVPKALESSTVDQATQLADLLIAQRAYEANSKTISVTDSMFDTLNNTGAH